MNCPSCGRDLGSGMLPARCPYCRHNLANVADSPGGAEGARRAQESRESARGLAGGADYKPPKAKKRWPVLVFLVLAAFIGIGVFAAYKLEFWGGNTLPDVRGWNLERAESDLQRLGYRTESSTQKDDGTAGLVLEMDPRPGSRLDEGTLVHLTVSEPRIMPEVVGKSRDEAKELMDAEGLTYEFVEVLDDGEADIVLRSAREAGLVSTSESPVELTVSMARVVPAVLDLTQEEATDLLESYGYTVEVKSVLKSKNQKEGVVIATEPDVGSRLANGSKVTISVTSDRKKKLEDLSKEILQLIYSWDPQKDKDQIAKLATYLDDSVKIGSKKASEATADELWKTFIKSSKTVPTDLDAKLDMLPRKLDSVDSIEVADDGTVTCKITVTWDWSSMGGEYASLTSTDTRTVTLKFNADDKLTAFTDPQSDVPRYRIAEQTVEEPEDDRDNSRDSHDNNSSNTSDNR